MRALVALAVLGVCSAFPIIPDDPLVAAEKERFLTTFKIIEEVSQPRGDSLGSRSADVYVVPPPQPKWTGPLASKVPAGLPGSTPFVSDTADVMNAKGQFFNTYNTQVVATRPRPGSPHNYYTEPGPAFKAPAPTRAPVASVAPVIIPAGPIYVPETPQKKWYGPLASDVPASLPGSSPVVFDTPEVNNAKAHFFNTYRQQVKAVVPRRFSQ
uniref:Cuticle protein BD1 n=1 Tax=Portunus pelagicus TaxID=80836 RepID=A1YLE5_PORPE|nr:cuticle protein BD1 [Portunus pelagicus]